MIAGWYDMRPGTIYAWFDRLEKRPIAEAIQHDPRPGAEPKLSRTEQALFERALSESPEKHGYDAPAWNSQLVKQYLRDEFETDDTQTCSPPDERGRSLLANASTAATNP